MTLFLAAAILSLLQFVDPAGQNLDPLLAAFLKRVNEHRFTIALGTILIQAICQVLLWVIGRARRLDIARLTTLLDAIAAHHFPDRDHRDHHYRATLFQVRRCWPIGVWLGAVARSGHLYGGKSTIFSIDPNRQAYNTGFAGECWRQARTIISPAAMPDQRAPNVPEDHRQEYKRLGWLSDEEYHRMQVYARVFMATPVRVKGMIWGILVLDSTDERTIPSANKRKECQLDLEFAATALGLMLS